MNESVTSLNASSADVSMNLTDDTTAAVKTTGAGAGGLAKAKVRRAIKKIAEYGATTAGQCWMVNDDVLQKHSLTALSLQNEWVWRTQETSSNKKKSVTSAASSAASTPARKAQDGEERKTNSAEVGTPKTPKTPKTSKKEKVLDVEAPLTSSTPKSVKPGNAKSTKKPRRVAMTTLTPAPTTTTDGVSTCGSKQDVDDDCVVTSVEPSKLEKKRLAKEKREAKVEAKEVGKIIVVDLDSSLEKGGEQVPIDVTPVLEGSKNEIELKEGSKIQEGKPDEGEALKTFEKEGKQEVDVSVNETAATPTENIESVEEKSVSKTVESDKAKKIKEKDEGEERTTEKKEKKKKEGNEEKAKKKTEKAANDVGVTPPSAKKRKLTPGKQTPSPQNASGKKKEKRQTTLEQMFAKSFSAKKLDMSKSEKGKKNGGTKGSQEKPMEID